MYALTLIAANTMHALTLIVAYIMYVLCCWYYYVCTCTCSCYVCILIHTSCVCTAIAHLAGFILYNNVFLQFSSTTLNDSTVTSMLYSTKIGCHFGKSTQQIPLKFQWSHDLPAKSILCWIHKTGISTYLGILTKNLCRISWKAFLLDLE